ncbi:uncharacterized protein LY79DRAFT_550182 [Colletotrichum navitas]|uniref:Uncharacterized protein n=1 Tax=Colletotrichum navitas TaxID=681940 RepID=A0AAD8Q2I0_9PEZI|nr:uncharacterized protein LY79DRAFT_550182 [Colletotrichum navitas]KAK1594220.1 hypothetical protein LY79DRAFT_550182 [Colletotrichum navitas]
MYVAVRVLVPAMLGVWDGIGRLPAVVVVPGLVWAISTWSTTKETHARAGDFCCDKGREWSAPAPS